MSFDLISRFDKGQLLGEMQVKKAFGGGLKLNNLRMDLDKLPTPISGRAQISGLNIADAISWSMPQHKGMVKGFLTGVFDLKTIFPGHGDMLRSSLSEGKWNIDSFFLSTLQIDEMVNSQINRVPGLRNKKDVKSGGVKALLKTYYKYNRGLLTFKGLEFLTPENNELKADGQLDLDQNIKIKGVVMVDGVSMRAEIKSCLADKNGRLEIPIEYLGKITEPKLSSANKTVAKLAQRYISCSTQRELKKVETKIKKEAQKELKKHGSRFEKDLKSKFKDLF